MSIEININGQIWMTKNLKTTQFANGDEIPFAKTKKDLSELTKIKSPAYCYSAYKKANTEEYGLLYNYYTIEDPRGLAPNGWRIPIVDDFKKMFDSISLSDKLVSITLKKLGFWGEGIVENPNGFNAVPSGSISFYNNQPFFCANNSKFQCGLSTFCPNKIKEYDFVDYINIHNHNENNENFQLFKPCPKWDLNAIRCIKI
jgi:uncharacterized protein (TIGR02145 family)